jgi:hypothetical protein
MTSYGSDYTTRNQQSGDVVADGGATLLSPFSEGETAIMAGPALLREIQAGVANGDMSVTPVDPTANISAENNLPYWTFTDVNSSGAITAKIVADAGAASGNVLRFTVASGTLTGKSATLTRYVPVASSASRSFSFYAEATFESGTNSTQATAKLTCQFYKADQVTTTGTAFESDVYGFNSLQSATGITAPDLFAVAPDLTNTTAPADAAYLKMTITIATVATQSADRVVDLTEVRLAHGLPELILTDKGDPATYQPAYILNESGDLSLVASTGENLVVGMNGYWLGSVSNTIESGGDINLIATGDIIGTGENVSLTANTAATIQAGAGAQVNLIAPAGVEITTDGSTLGVIYAGDIHDTTGDLQVIAEGGDVILRHGVTSGTAPRLLFRDGAGTYYGGIQMTGTNSFRFYNGSATNDYGYLLAERIYAMDGTTASRYMFDNGTQTAFSGPVLAGAITSTGNVSANQYSADSITGTTATTNAAIWVLTAGTTYNLRRNTSSARYKTNITDADDAVLEAARKIRPRHYESTIEDEAGATRLGFIAEEVEAAGLTHAVGYDAEGRVDTIDPTALIAALFARVNDLEQRLADLESR